MSEHDNLLRLIRDAERNIQLEKPSAALPYLHKAFFYSGQFNDVRAIACLKLASVCRATGQYFIGAEFLREASYIASSSPQIMRLLSLDLAYIVNLFSDDPHRIVEKTYSDLIFTVTRIWHAIGIPFLPDKECLILSNVHRVDHPYPFFSNISLICGLPIEQMGSVKAVFNPLLTAFDTNLGPHVEQRFEQTVSALEKGIDPSSVLLAVERLPTISIILSIPRSELPALEQVCSYFSSNGVPVELLEDAPTSHEGNDYVRAGLDAARKGADLFCISFMRKACKLFEGVGDHQGQRMARINEALSFERLGQKNIANAIAFSLYADAKRANDNEIIEIIRESFPRLFEKENISNVSKDLKDKILTVENDRPFILDKSSGKVIGGALASEVAAELEANKALNEAWTQEFPGIPTPFPIIISANSFEWKDESFFGENPLGKLSLGQSIRMTPLEGTMRLAEAKMLEVPLGYTEEEYAIEFVTRIMSAILVAHKRLCGAYSSETGTSISAGNVSTRGHIFDFETFRSPTLGDESDLGPAQIQDLINAVYLIHTFLRKLGRLDLMAEMMEKSVSFYQTKDRIDKELSEIIIHIAVLGEEIQQNRPIVGKFSRMLCANAAWRV